VIHETKRKVYTIKVTVCALDAILLPCICTFGVINFSRMLYRFLTLALFLLPIQAFAQSWEIFGYVHNENSEPLPGARITVDDSVQVNTKEGGFFQIKTLQRPKVLTVRCLGYFSQRIELREQDFKKRKTSLDLSLFSQSFELKAVDIAAKKVETLVEETFQTNILDFDFLGANLALLVKEKKRFFLQLMSDRGTVIQHIELDNSAENAPRFLHRSCFGDLLLVSWAHVNEITLSAGGRMDTFPRFDIARFNQFVATCAQENQGFLYYVHSGSVNQALTYWYITPTGDRQVLAKIVDEKQLEDALEAYFALLQGIPFSSRGPSRDAPAVNATTYGFDLPDADQYASFNIDMDQLFRMMGSGTGPWISVLQRIYQDSAYAPLFKVGQNLILFDHVNGKLWQFDPTFQMNQERQIAYHKEKGWLKELLQDHDSNQNIYAHFAAKGSHDLRKINLENGSIDKQYPVPEVDLLSQNFKVRSGQLYYLGQPDVNTPNHKLYKVNIAQKSK
jgi:hypothetical protein